MTEVFLTSWISDGDPREFPGEPRTTPPPPETANEFYDRYEIELRAVFKVLPPDPNTAIITSWMSDNVEQKCEWDPSTDGPFDVDAYIDRLLDGIEIYPPDNT